MAKQTLNLKYATDGLGLFSKIAKINTIISNYKKTHSISEFTAADDVEIGRGRSYAFFPELAEFVAQGGQITVDRFRQCLTNRGINDVAFQNKILTLTLQNKSGIQFGMGRIIDGLFLENGFLLAQNPDYQIDMDVTHDDRVSLVYTGVWEDPTTEPRTPAIKACVKINISPDMVAISAFDLTKLSDNPVATAAYHLIEENQQNIIMKIITFIMHVFGFNSELRLEEKQEGDLSWAPGLV